MTRPRTTFLRWGEVSAFVILAFAVHFGVLWLVSKDSAEGGRGGSGGGAVVTMRAADAGIAAMVAEWDKPPETSDAQPVTGAPAPPDAPETKRDIAERPQRPDITTPETDVTAPPPVTPSRPDAPPQVATPRLAPLPDTPEAPVSDAPVISEGGPRVVAPATMPDAPPLAPDMQAAAAPPPQQPAAPLPPEDVVEASAPQAAPAPRRRPDAIKPVARQRTTPAPVKPEPAPQSQTAEAPTPTEPAATEPAAAEPGEGAVDQVASAAAGIGGESLAGDAGAVENGGIDEGALRDALREWGQAIHARVERKKKAPRTARRSGTVALLLTVARSGALTEVRVAKGSGSARLDRAGVQAAQRAAPFKAAPGEVRDDTYQFQINIIFRL